MARETVTIEGLDTVVRRLKALGPMASVRGGPVRAAVRKAAMVIVVAAQENVQQIIDTPNVNGDDESTGLLKKSIKAFRAKAKPGENGETYVVTVKRRQKYSDSNAGKLNTATINGQRLEYGTSKRKPMPWMRPAFHSKKEEAAKVMVTEVERVIAKLEAKVAATVR